MPTRISPSGRPVRLYEPLDITNMDVHERARRFIDCRQCGAPKGRRCRGTDGRAGGYYTHVMRRDDLLR